MNSQSALLACLLAVLSVSVRSEEDRVTAYIVNGDPAGIDEEPYIVQLRRAVDEFFFCGGSLMSLQYVISAAHCLKNVKPSETVIVGGATYITDIGVRRNIVSWSIPKLYDFTNPTSTDDIVVFKLNAPMPFGNNIQPIALSNRGPKEGELCQVSGWGSTNSGSGSASNQLLTIRVPVVATTKCRQLYSNFAPIYGSMFCAANLETAQDSCQGDSGGPLIINGTLAGVVSWGRGCARPDSPGVYTNIYYMMDFIQNSISKLK